MSAILNTRAALSLTRQHFRNLGLTLPATLTDALAELEAAASRATKLPRPGALRKAVLDALLADRDLATDQTVLTELARQQLTDSGVATILGDEIEQRRRNALDEAAPAILDALTPVIVEADKVIAAAREMIGDGLNLDDANAMAELRPAQMTPWATAREAAARVEMVAQCWVLTAQSAGLVNIDHNKKALILANLTAEQLDDLGYRPKPSQVIAAGHRLSLASPAEFVGRCRRVDGQRQQAVIAAETAQRNAMKPMRQAAA
ncbi:hypothetical protein ACIBTV_21295 [Micromonospora sp. NPDC049366]|uniref:hypothetical protein n=1 Tax=Micromonospora sp. NPDC049366 TaxID=3364271 RepID=UPI00378EB9BE